MKVPTSSARRAPIRRASIVSSAASSGVLIIPALGISARLALDPREDVVLAGVADEVGADLVGQWALDRRHRTGRGYESRAPHDGDLVEAEAREHDARGAAERLVGAVERHRQRAGAVEQRVAVAVVDEVADEREPQR